MAFTSGWDGEGSAPDAAHVYIKAANSAGSASLGELAGGSSSSYAAIGLIKVLNSSDETESLERNAENSKTAIKMISGNRKKSYTIEALVTNDVNLSLANGVIATYDSADVDISSSPESIYGDVIIMFMKDGSDWLGSACVSDRGERMQNCLIKSMGKSPSYTGKDAQVYRFEITPFKDDDGNLYTDLEPRTFDATADYLGLSDFSPAIT